MAKVSNLSVKVQTGTDNVLLATWEFDAITKTTSSGAVQVGSWVKVKSGSKWYNGVGIASFVFNDTWQVIQINGNRVVINKNPSGTHAIMSPIHINNLTTDSGASTTTSTDTLDHFTVKWYYDTGDGVWFEGSSTTVDHDYRYSTYTMPDNAINIKVHVTPVAKTHTVNNTSTSYWTGEVVVGTFDPAITPPDEPPSPSVEIDKYNLTVTCVGIEDSKIDQIEFQIYNGTTLFTSGTVDVQDAIAAMTFTVNPGGEYRVRARSINNVTGGNVYSDWTSFTSSLKAIPSAPTSISTIRAASTTSIYLVWTAVTTADTYDIEYATQLDYFDNSSATTTISGIEFNHYTVTGLETGDEYFFRVRATNTQGSSAWTNIKSVVIGKKPNAPTTWSSTTTAIVGETLTLYWVHNSQDNSKETYAELELTVDGDTFNYTIKAPDSEEDEEEKTYSYTVDTSSYSEGTTIKWRVRTAGITLEYGDYSVLRTIDVYAQPTLSLTLLDKDEQGIEAVTSFPFYIKGLAGPATQEPIAYSVSIISNGSYETYDNVGRATFIETGSEIYTTHVDTKDPLYLEMTPTNIDLQSGVSYTITVVVAMNSGLTAEAVLTFDVSWEDVQYPLDAEIAVDTENYVAFIEPYSRNSDGTDNENLLLSVYRRQFDGGFVQVVSDIASGQHIVATDPHPALDYARYRIVAKDQDTGAVTYYDPPGYPVNGIEAILQWDEAWSDFHSYNSDSRMNDPYSGSLLRLKYNIDVSDSNTPDSSLVKYIGREYPVSYYGTQNDYSATWNMDVPKTDTETLYALRRLQVYHGDVYVREPSGSGYWANLTVDYSQTHKELVIPVTLTLTRVEGGL